MEWLGSVTSLLRRISLLPLYTCCILVYEYEEYMYVQVPTSTYEKTAHGSLFCNSGKNQTAFFSCLFRPVSIEVET
jgi:hypothetical protein